MVLAQGSNKDYQAVAGTRSIKIAKTSPTVLTRNNLKQRGYLPATVEKYNHAIKCKQDLYGFIDVIGVSDKGTIAVQSTSGGGSGKSNINARHKKIAENEHVRTVLAAGWIIETHNWIKVKNRWQVDITIIDQEWIDNG